MSFFLVESSSRFSFIRIFALELYSAYPWWLFFFLWYEKKNASFVLSIPFFIIGATARDIIFECCYGIRSPRMTKDIDLGVKVSDWKDYSALSDALVKAGHFLKKREGQRFAFRDILIDLVPFGPITDKDNKVSWPPEHSIVLNVVGFEEAYQFSTNVRICKNPELDIKIPTLPGLTIMKLVSWKEMEQVPQREKHAKDLLFIMRNYAETFPDTRLYKKEIKILEEEGFDNNLAGIRLLGKDMAHMSSLDTLKMIKAILLDETKEQDIYRLVSDMVGTAEQFDEVLVQVKKLTQGVFGKAGGADIG